MLNNNLYTYNWGKNWEKEEIPLFPPLTLIICLIMCFLLIVWWSRILRSKGKRRQGRKEMHSLIMWNGS